MSDSFALLSGIAQGTQNPLGTALYAIISAVSFPIADFGFRLLASAVAFPAAATFTAVQILYSLTFTFRRELKVLETHTFSLPSLSWKFPLFKKERQSRFFKN